MGSWNVQLSKWKDPDQGHQCEMTEHQEWLLREEINSMCSTKDSSITGFHSNIGSLKTTKQNLQNSTGKQFPTCFNRFGIKSIKTDLIPNLLWGWNKTFFNFQCISHKPSQNKQTNKQTNNEINWERRQHGIQKRAETNTREKRKRFWPVGEERWWWHNTAGLAGWTTVKGRASPPSKAEAFAAVLEAVERRFSPVISWGYIAARHSQRPGMDAFSPQPTPTLPSTIRCVWVYVPVCVSHSVMSDCLWSHGLWPARLLCPWNSPGKNTGLVCHSLLQGVFPTQESKPGLLHCSLILYLLSVPSPPLALPFITRGLA